MSSAHPRRSSTRFLRMANPRDIDYDGLETLRKLHYELLRLPSIKSLAQNSGSYVSGEGDSPVAMLIGEAPGALEDMKRRPFVGPSGAVLRSLMATAGLYATAWPTGIARPKRALSDVQPVGGYAPNCWLTNVVKFRPPRNRTPTRMEIRLFRPLLRKEWFAVGQPQVIVPIGASATQAVFGKSMSVLNFAGKPIEIQSRDGQWLVVWPMIHPSYGLWNEAARPIMDQHWEQLGKWLKEL